MVTVKYNEDEEGNKRIILKDGKVSCSCCPEPQECCMYPAQALYDGDYSVDDLPDAIVATNSRGSHVLTKDGYGGGVSGFEPIISGAIYGNNDPAEDETVVTLQEGGEGVAWIYGSGLGGGENACLITETEPIIGGVEDQFADTYTVDDGSTNPYTITRVSLCEWRGPTSEDPNTIGILEYYGFDPESIFYTKWVYNLADGGPKSGNQNTPVGQYPREGGAGFISIS